MANIQRANITIHYEKVRERMMTNIEEKQNAVENIVEWTKFYAGI